MARTTFAAVFAGAVLLGAPQGSVQALGIDDNVDGGAVTAPEATTIPAPAAQPEVIVRVPETEPRSSVSAPALPESFSPDPTTKPASGSATLAALDSGQRDNAGISLEPMGSPSDAQLLVGAQVEALWASGRYAEAMSQLEFLERSGQPYAVSISWKQPVPVTHTKYYPDMRISDRTNGIDLALDYHSRTGNIFAMVVWPSGWSLHMSTDLGNTWNETAFWGGAYTTIADMAVSGDHVWVGYSSNGDAFHTSRFRRFDADTGVEDAAYGFQVVGDAGTNTMTEIKVLGNTPDNDDRIYMAYIVNETDSIHFWWDDLAGMSFTEIPTSITNADAGLDITWNPHTSSGYRRFISYHSTDGRVRLARSNGSVWEFEDSRVFTGVRKRTAMSAFGDHVYCAFECDTGSGKIGVCYLESHDAGVTSWLYDDAYWPTGDEVSGHAPDFSVRSGTGAAAVFSSETGALDDVYFVTHRGWTSGSWTDPVWYNSFDHVSGADTYIKWIGSLCVSTYGMAYFDDVGYGSPYFDLMRPRGFFCDGFESGTTGAWN